MSKIPMMILGVLAVAFLSLFALVRYYESVSIFFPDRELTSFPDAVGLRYEDVYLTTSDGIHLNGWFLKKQGATWTVLYFHGNAGNLSDRLEKLKAFNQMGFNVFIIDYRGYGKSGGKPGERGLYRDARAAFDYLKGRQDIGNTKILVYGASIGGAVAIDLALHRPVDLLATEATFTSARDFAKMYYPWAPVFMMTVQFDSVSKIAAVKAPKIFFHSRADEVIPYAMAESLFNAAAGPKTLVEVEGTHNDNFLNSQAIVRETLADVIKKFE